MIDRSAVASLLALALASIGWVPLSQAEPGRLRQATSWAYQLQGDLGRLSSSSWDVAVVDADHARSAVSRLKRKPDGTRRAVLAYISIGEAETGRAYWRSCCAGRHPSWLTGRTQGWSGNYVVRFWEPAWQHLVASRIRAALAAGFDGLYLDRVDTYESTRAPGGSRDAMIRYVASVSRQARSQKPGAVILVQNAEELLTSDAFLAAIDGIAKEDLIHGINHDGRRNQRGDIAASVALLKRAKQRGKAIFVVEYLSGGTGERVAAEIRRLGFVPHLASRSLSRAGH